MFFPDIPTATGTTRLFLRVLPGLVPSLSFIGAREGRGIPPENSNSFYKHTPNKLSRCLRLRCSCYKSEIHLIKYLLRESFLSNTSYSFKFSQSRSDSNAGIAPGDNSYFYCGTTLSKCQDKATVCI